MPTVGGGWDSLILLTSIPCRAMSQHNLAGRTSSLMSSPTPSLGQECSDCSGWHEHDLAGFEQWLAADPTLFSGRIPSWWFSGVAISFAYAKEQRPLLFTIGDGLERLSMPDGSCFHRKTAGAEYPQYAHDRVMYAFLSENWFRMRFRKGRTALPEGPGLGLR